MKRLFLLSLMEAALLAVMSQAVLAQDLAPAGRLSFWAQTGRLHHKFLADL